MSSLLLQQACSALLLIPARPVVSWPHAMCHLTWLPVPLKGSLFLSSGPCACCEFPEATGSFCPLLEGLVLLGWSTSCFCVTCSVLLIFWSLPYSEVSSDQAPFRQNRLGVVPFIFCIFYSLYVLSSRFIVFLKGEGPSVILLLYSSVQCMLY